MDKGFRAQNLEIALNASNYVKFPLDVSLIKFLLVGKFKAIDYTSIWQISGEIVIFGPKPHVPFNSHIYKGIQRERGFWAQNPEIALNASNYV